MTGMLENPAKNSLKEKSTPTFEFCPRLLSRVSLKSCTSFFCLQNRKGEILRNVLLILFNDFTKYEFGGFKLRKGHKSIKVLHIRTAQFGE